MPPKSKGMPSADPRAADAYKARAKCLCKLPEAEDDWWEGVEVNVPWAAAGAAYSQRADAWLGFLSEVVENGHVVTATTR